MREMSGNMMRNLEFSAEHNISAIRSKMSSKILSVYIGYNIYSDFNSRKNM